MIKKLPPDILESENFKVIREQVEAFLDVYGPQDQADEASVVDNSTNDRP